MGHPVHNGSSAISVSITGCFCLDVAEKSQAPSNLLCFPGAQWCQDSLIYFPFFLRYVMKQQPWHWQWVASAFSDLVELGEIAR